MVVILWRVLRKFKGATAVALLSVVLYQSSPKYSLFCGELLLTVASHHPKMQVEKNEVNRLERGDDDEH